jgi:glyoxalase family protein
MTNGLTTSGFHHITMVSTDAARTLAFYGDLLGLSLVKKTVNFDDPGAYHLYFGVDGGRPGTILTFFEWRDARRGHWGAGGVHHLALGVETPEALLKWKRRLNDAGVAADGPIDRGYFQSLYFADPDGQILEIATAGPGYTIDEPADALGHELVVPPAERLPSGRDEVMAGATHPEPVPVITPDMALQGIHHISAITDRLEESGTFYEEALGLRLVKKTYNQDDGQTKHFFWAAYDGEVVSPHSSLTLFDWSRSTLRERPGAGQTHHVAFRADSAEQQLEWRDHLLGLGIDVSPVMERTYFESIYFRAPDGLLVEIATDGPGFGVDEEELGSNLMLPKWLETRRPAIEGSLLPLP